MSGKSGSHPSRVRGLKPIPRDSIKTMNIVAPLAGAWIETPLIAPVYVRPHRVAPLAGAWIETNILLSKKMGILVAPLAGAWIETSITVSSSNLQYVAPLAGAWIETPQALYSLLFTGCRTPRGCVD